MTAAAVATAVAGDARRAFLAAAVAAVDLLGHPGVAERWDADSACDGWHVGALAAHLARAVTQVDHHLADAPPDLDGDAPVTAGAYYASLPGLDDPQSELSAAVRERSTAAATAGAAGVLDAALASLATLEDRLPAEPPDRVVAPLGVPMCLDEYLRTRLVEICVHIEDLSLSVGLDLPDLPDDAVRGAVDVLVDCAVHRHGPVKVLRALARRDRDHADALHLF